MESDPWGKEELSSHLGALENNSCDQGTVPRFCVWDGEREGVIFLAPLH